MLKLGQRALTGLVAVLALLAGPVLGSAQPAVPTAPSPDLIGWELFGTAATNTMYAVDMVDSTEGWAGGAAGFMMHYTGGDWVAVNTDFDSAVLGIDMLSASSGWGVTWNHQLLRYNGTWTVHSTPGAAPLDDIYMLSETDGWVVGGQPGTIRRLDATDARPQYRRPMVGARSPARTIRTQASVLGLRRARTHTGSGEVLLCSVAVTGL